jgi:hypothetical protein
MRRSIDGLTIVLAASFVAPLAHGEIVFSSGPYNGSINGWGIYDSGGLDSEPKSDNFVLSGPAILSSATFDVWATPGTTMETVDWAVLSGGPDAGAGGTVIASGAAAPVTQANLLPGASQIFGFDIDSETFVLPAVQIVQGGTYWLELSHGNDAGGDGFYWDENDNPNNIPGLAAWDGLLGSLDPSNPLANSNGCSGSVPCTETFSISGTTTPEPGGVRFAGSVLAGLAVFIRRRIARQ